MTDFEKVLIERDEMNDEEAHDSLEEAQERVSDGESPEVILAEYGMESDYFLDICP